LGEDLVGVGGAVRAATGTLNFGWHAAINRFDVKLVFGSATAQDLDFHKIF
jgi:hypothetical protein